MYIRGAGRKRNREVRGKVERERRIIDREKREEIDD
jgi:hypothetical protein